jgi:hypothetical protein
MNIENANKALHYLERTAPLIEAEIGRLAEKIDLDSACWAFADIRALKERAEALASSIQAIEKLLANEIIPLQLDASNTESPYNHAVGKFTRTARVSASILKDSKDKAWAWLKKNGLGGLIIETVNAQTLGATARQMLEKGQELPSDLFTTSTHVYVAFTPVKEK